MKFACVAVNIPVKNIFQQFTYRVPPRLGFITPGWRVVVPFGGRLLEGFVLAEDESVAPDIKYKDIVETVGDEPWFDEEMLATARWISDYYMCTAGEALRLFIPGKQSIASFARFVAVRDFAGKLQPREEELYVYLLQHGEAARKEIEALPGGRESLKGLLDKGAVRQDFSIRKKLNIKTVNVFHITDAGQTALADTANERLKAQIAALDIIRNNPGLESNMLTQQGISAQTLRTLLAKGWILRSAQRVLRNSYRGCAVAPDLLPLNLEQQKAFFAVEACLTEGEHRTFLLHGITGSGKTEVYLRLALRARELGKQTVLLVPEIALTGQIVRRFQSCFGDRVAVAHSKLSPSERADVWQRLKQDDADVLIGVRSAIFAPMGKVGLIIIDEEHEYTYKQEERPYYNAKNIALHRAGLASIPVVLGSATPDLNSYYKAQIGEYVYLPLTQRATEGSVLPEVEIADMRTELAAGNRSVFSGKLRQELLQVAAEGEQAIVLLNRRGYYTFIMCRDCGEVLSCPNCATSLVYHNSMKSLTCHYCGNTVPIPRECPHCHSKRIKGFGTGTEKAVEELGTMSPALRPLRMDQDSTLGKFAHDDILKAFAGGNYNVLLGTQMVAKGHDIANVTLVGILSADSQLNMPDYRAAERTFALLTQAAGRAGRGQKPGRVIIQAYEADSRIIRLAAAQDYQGFAGEELKIRQETGYPPFASLMKITVLDPLQEKSISLAQRIANFLEAKFVLPYGKGPLIEILGPFAALVAKVENIYRTNILVKGSELEQVKKGLLASEFKSMPNVYFDVDPINVL